jgi:hypothetical protein
MTHTASAPPVPVPAPVPVQDVPSIAVSLDNYLARTEDQYAAAATYTVALCKAVLGILPPPGGGRHAFGASHLSGHVVNVNVPKGALSDIRGLYLAHQGQHCHFPDFQARGCCCCWPACAPWTKPSCLLNFLPAFPTTPCLPHRHACCRHPPLAACCRSLRLMLRCRRGMWGRSRCVCSATQQAACGETYLRAATRGP